MNTRLLTTAKGRSVETSLTDQEAIDGLIKIPGTFAADLAYKAKTGGLSTDQITWAHILVIDARGIGSANVGDMSGIISIFTKAAENLKAPRVKLQAAGRKVVLSLCGARSKFPGHIYVTDGGPYGEGVYYGRITPEGNFTGRGGFPELLPFLRSVATNPAEVIGECGRLMGACCFCSIPLEDERSTAVGYGPKCADNFGLPWGEAGAEAAKATAKRTRKAKKSTDKAPQEVPAPVASEITPEPSPINLENPAANVEPSYVIEGDTIIETVTEAEESGLILGALYHYAGNYTEKAREAGITEESKNQKLQKAQLAKVMGDIFRDTGKLHINRETSKILDSAIGRYCAVLCKALESAPPSHTKEDNQEIINRKRQIAKLEAAEDRYMMYWAFLPKSAVAFD